jgi:hypothetical protein
MAPASRLEKPATRVYSSPNPTQPDNSTIGELRVSPQNLIDKSPATVNVSPDFIRTRNTA